MQCIGANRHSWRATRCMVARRAEPEASQANYASRSDGFTARTGNGMSRLIA